MYLTGFADEASQDIRSQIEVTKELGWNSIEARSIEGTNIHDICEGQFQAVKELLNSEGIRINCFGSTIANWSKRVTDPFEVTVEEVERAIPRMQELGTRLVRVMSYARCLGKEQYKEERFRRLREVCNRFLDSGIIPVHENCMNYGGMSWRHSLELIDNVPGMKLVFDTGNPVISVDHSSLSGEKQDPIEFFTRIKEHVAYIHIKDASFRERTEYFLYPGEGDAQIPKILRMLKDADYQGGISIEPHMASVFHDPNANVATDEESYSIYVEYGRRLMKLLAEIDYNPILYQ